MKDFSEMTTDERTEWNEKCARESQLAKERIVAKVEMMRKNFNSSEHKQDFIEYVNTHRHNL